MADSPTYNTNLPSIRRLLKEVKEMEKENNNEFQAFPLEDNLFEWHFTIRGPPDTEFEGGIYHGRIILPAEYPFKPPHIVWLTPNGRFEVGKKICLSISAYHPEHWQPSWSIRSILAALIGFLPTTPEGAIGSLDYSAEERKKLAKQSISWKCDRCKLENSSAFPSNPNQSEKDKASVSPNTNLAPQPPQSPVLPVQTQPLSPQPLPPPPPPQIQPPQIPQQQTSVSSNNDNKVLRDPTAIMIDQAIAVLLFAILVLLCKKFLF